DLTARWQVAPPGHPVILAGSTGSRGTTLLLMKAIARLPQGAVILPGFDFDLPDSVWSHFDMAVQADDHPPAVEDHPQYRFHKLITDLGTSPEHIAPWHDVPAPSPARNAAVSLALRPAPVTDAWLGEGPGLRDLDKGFADVTLVEAPSPRAEALAIALRLRQAAEDGIKAALITPDRMLTRQVTAALNRWGILPDDSAGTPLQLSPPGRFLRHVAHLFQRRVTTDQLLTLLKHPLTRSTGDRGKHLLMTRELELYLRKTGNPFPDAPMIRAWEATQQNPLPGWADWVIDSILLARGQMERPLSEWANALERQAEQIAGAGIGAGELWQQKAGREARAVIDDLIAQAAHGGDMGASDFGDLVGALLSRGEVRDRDAPHPDIMIWGTLEARVQGADLLILGGLNEGTWPEAAKPDPWLNRQMRARAGLLMPDRRIGLSAHDFQQAIGAPEVWLTRAIRSEDAQTVPSRWINRLTNLLEGLPQAQGTQVLADMRARGETWLRWSQALEHAPAIAPAPRPSPRPPVAARPRQLSVTDIKRLIRDPYAIYARHVLRLKPLDPLVRLPDPRIKGIVVHDVLERYIKALDDGTATLDRDSFLAMALEALEQDIPWPTARLLWLGQLARSADWFLAGEAERRKTAQCLASEVTAGREIPALAFTLTARADRIDQTDDGDLILYDYKTGQPPTKPQQQKFDKQLLLEAAMAEAGAFRDIPAAPVAQAVFIGLGAGKISPAPLEDDPPAKVWDEFCELIAAYLQESTGYTSRRMLEKDTDTGDYDQLARYGEWDDTHTPTPEDLT
ncbi:double-strand break repair protein AddB, partial [Aestuariivita boseongensis]|uniref:double-strand break repair protein AddB n=1 Tax=Aestuariivita boseongensis TaxID=1470562 RepID=UPI000681E808